MRDWMGNSKTTFAQLGASSHSDKDREINDFYSTDPHTLEIFLDKIKEDGIKLDRIIWECACGQGHLSKVLEKKNHIVLSTDLVNRGYGIDNIDFLKVLGSWGGDILTNPPYKYAKEFVEHSLELIDKERYVVMLLKIQFLEGKSRRKLFSKYPPEFVYVNSERQLCYPNGDMTNKISSATCYCWFMWRKGYDGEPKIRWI